MSRRARQASSRHRSKWTRGLLGSFNIAANAGGFGDRRLSTGSDGAEYPDVTADNAAHAMAPFEFGAWVLGNFATVDDVKARIQRGDKFVLVDVREESEWAKDHLPHAERWHSSMTMCVK